MLPRLRTALRSRAALCCVVAIVVTGTASGLGIAHAQQPRPMRYSCDRGSFCFWSAPGYHGRSQFFDLRTVNPGDCFPLPDGFRAHSFADRSFRELTVYEDPQCGSSAGHLVYPGGGTFVPRAPFEVAAFRITPRPAAGATGPAAHVTRPHFPTADTGCPRDRLCYWPEAGFPGKPRVLDPGELPHGRCFSLPHGDEGRSFVNHTAGFVTLYQGGHCSTNGEFRTYPGRGTYVPDAPYVVRAVEIWGGPDRATTREATS